MSDASHILGLVDILPRLDPDALSRVLSLRHIPPLPTYSSVGLAGALVAHTALNSHLSQLTADELEVLNSYPRGSSAADSPFLDQLLVWSDGVTTHRRAEIDALWDTLPLGHRVEASAEPLVGESSPVDPDVAGVFGEIENLERLLDHLCAPPRGHGRARDRSECASMARELQWTEAEVTSLVDAALHLGFLHETHSSLQVTPAGTRWRTQGAAHKWHTILRHWRTRLPRWWPRPLPSPVTVEPLTARAAHAYPLVILDGIETLVADAERWGVIKGGVPTTLALWSDELEAQLSSLLPPAATMFYPDGPDTVISTGPLDDEWELAIRSFAEWISGSLAPRFRITPRSICGALQRGISTSDLTARVATLIPSGMGNVIGEMASDTISRATSLSLISERGASLLVSDNPLTLKLIEADRRLAHAGLVLSDDGLRSPWSPEALSDVLFDEGYPHLHTREDGELVSVEASHSDEVSARGSAWTLENVASLQAEMRRAPAWSAGLVEAVELAIRHKVALALTVSMNGTEVVMRIEPHALKNGRLRGLDTRSDVERTIPMSHVLSVTAGD